MAVHSNNSEFSLGLQSNASTAATLFTRFLSAESGGRPERERQEVRREHPGPAPLAARHRTKQRSRGYTVPVRNTTQLRPRSFPRLLQALGMTCVTTSKTTHYEHVFKYTAASSAPIMTALHKWVGDTNETRRWTKLRGEELSIVGNASSGDIMCTLSARAMAEDDAPGVGLTISDEVDVLLSVYTGSLTATINGDTVTTAVRDETLNLAQVLDLDNRLNHLSTRPVPEVRERDASGTMLLDSLDASTYKWYMEVFRGDVAGTAAVLDEATGSLEWTYESEELIPDAAVPYSVKFSLPSVGFDDFEVPNSSGDDIIRPTLHYYMIADVSDPLVITVNNDVASYAAT